MNKVMGCARCQRGGSEQVGGLRVRVCFRPPGLCGCFIQGPCLFSCGAPGARDSSRLHRVHRLCRVLSEENKRITFLTSPNIQFDSP